VAGVTEGKARALLCAAGDEVLRAYLSVRRSAEDVEGTVEGGGDLRLRVAAASMSYEEDTCMSYEEEDTCLRSSTPPAPLSSAQLERDMIFQSPCCRALVSSPGVEPCWNLVAV
jgi:hypothetical protein